MKRLVLASILLLIPSLAPAAPDASLAKAKELFSHAEALYALTRYDEALAEYEKAFEAKPLPGFLFNIGQCHRQLRHYEKAAYFYRSYLERQPHARNRAIVESLIKEMDERQGRPATTDGSTRSSPPPRSVEEPSRGEPDRTVPPGADLTQPTPSASGGETPLYRRWYLWAAVGGVVVLSTALGLGIGLGSHGGVTVPQGSLSTIDAR